MMILSPHAQGTPEWFQDRCGKATGSMAATIISKGRTKGAEATGRRNYRYQLALERITGKVQESGFSNLHTERGNELEKFARMAYEAASGLMVVEAGFAYLPDYPIGCSVDGMVDDSHGFNEFKCPIPAIHYSYIEANRLPLDYVAQVTHNFYVTGCEFCDFASYCEEMPEKLQLFTFRVMRDEAAIKEYQAELQVFLAEVSLLEKDIRERAK